MRWRGLAQPRDTFPPISQRPLRRSATYQGQERSRCSGRDQITGWLGAPRAVTKDFLFANRPGFPPSRVAPNTSSASGSELSFTNRSGFPPNQKAQVFPSPGGSELSSRYATRGFPSATQLEVFPSPTAQSFLLRTRLGVSPPPHTLKFSLHRWPEVPPCGFPSCRGGTGLSPRPEAPKSAQHRVARGFPRTGGSEFPPCRWRRTSPCPKARSCPLPGGSGFPLRRLPSLVVGKFLRLSTGLHKRFRAAISRFFRRPQAIHS
jgi:hypothetical protein